MKVFDVHIHSTTDYATINPEKLLADMEKAGVWGGAVFTPEAESPLGCGYSYEERIDCMHKWTDGYKDRLFPIFYIHPYEKDAIAKAKDAVDQGAMGFKMSCDCYYVYEEKCMELLRTIADMNKPVLFHSGILWDGHDSSKHNRPLNWESLINIPGLRFSLAHCSWPWCDETIAMYGKFLNAYATNPSMSAELYLDTTPGTPKIYRYDLINKIYNCGYDTPRNVLFGADSTANEYNIPWVMYWVENDGKIMDDIGAKKKLHELYFAENYKRFFGLKEKDFQHVMPVPDRADSWSLDMANEIL